MTSSGQQGPLRRIGRFLENPGLEPPCGWDVDVVDAGDVCTGATVGCCGCIAMNSSTSVSKACITSCRDL